MDKRIFNFIKLIDYRKQLKKNVMLFLLVLGIPAATSFILGYEMQAKQIQHIPTVIMDADDSSFSRMLVEEIKTNEIFDVAYYSQSNEEIENLIQDSKAKMAVIIPASFSKDLKAGLGPKILICYDPQMAIFSASKSRICEILLSIKTGFLQKIAIGRLNSTPDEAMHNVLPMYFNYRLLNNPTKSYTNFLLPGLLAGVLQVGLAMLGACRIREDEKYFSWILFKCLLWGVVGAVSIILTMFIQFEYFGMLYRGTVKGGIILTLLFSIGIVALGILVHLIIPSGIAATQISAVLVLPTPILVGYTFPLMSMPTAFEKFAYYIPFLHYSEPLRDLCVKSIGMEYIQNEIYWLAKFIIVMWISSFIVFISKKVIKKVWLDLFSSKKEKKIWDIDKKERCRATILRVKNVFIIVIIPIFFTFLFAALYSKVFVEEIPIVILDQDHSSLSRMIIREFNNGPGFHITYYAQSEKEVEEKIKTKTAFVGLIIPKNFNKDVNMMNAPKTLLLIDETNLVIGNNALSYGSTILDTLNAGIQLRVLEKKGDIAKGMGSYAAEKAVISLSFVERILYDPQLNYLKFLLFGLEGIFIQQTFLVVLVPILIEEREKLQKIKIRSKEGRKRLASIAGRILSVAILAILDSILCFYFLHKYFYLPLRGSVVYSLLLLIVFVVNLIGISILLASIFENIVHSLQFIMFLSIPTFLTAGYIWPEFMMPTIFATMLKKIWPLIYFITPLRDMHIKASGLAVIEPYLQGGIYYALLWVPIAGVLYVLKIYITKQVRRKLDSLLAPAEEII